MHFIEISFIYLSDTIKQSKMKANNIKQVEKLVSIIENEINYYKYFLGLSKTAQKIASKTIGTTEQVELIIQDLEDVKISVQNSEIPEQSKTEKILQKLRRNKRLFGTKLLETLPEQFTETRELAKKTELEYSELIELIEV